MRGLWRRWSEQETGASVVEYSLLIALIVIVCIGGVSFIGAATSNTLSTSGSAFNQEV